MRGGILLAVTAAGLALALACSGSSTTGDTVYYGGGVDPDTTENCPAEDVGDLDPIEAVGLAPYHLSGSARWTEGGDIEIVLNPVINTDDGAVRDDVDPTTLTAAYGGEDVDIVGITQAGGGQIVPTDIVFVLDTTGSMFWAIDGVKQGISAFVDAVEISGLDARIGGIEYGDEVRTGVDPTEVGDFRDWVEGLSATGGGDAPENGLDAIAAAYSNFDFRPGAQKYFVLVTDVGMHEAGNLAGCSNSTLADIVALTGGQVLYGVLMATLGGETGLAPRWITDAMGGLYAEINVADAMLSFDIAGDTPFDELIGGTWTIEIPSEALVGLDGDAVTLTWATSARDYVVELPIE